MSIIQWGIDFYTGLPDIDNQHQKLVALANRLSDVPLDQPDDLEQAFIDLRNYVQQHFSLEERMMEEACVDAGHFQYHKRAHALFAAKVSELWDARASGSGHTMEQLLAFLTTWILQHILHTDQKMALEIHTRLGTSAPHNMFAHF
jgi:hemerythrin